MLKSRPELADQDPKTLEHLIKAWHDQALPHIQTKAFEETNWDFRDAWKCVKFPLGDVVLERCNVRAMQSAPPKCAEGYEDQTVKLLVALCRELQRELGTAPFFLSCRTVEHLLGVSYKTANRWLRGLETDGVLKVVERPPR